MTQDRWPIDPAERKRPVDLGLTEAQCDFLATALDVWGSGARLTPAVARFAGFGDAAAMEQALPLLIGALHARADLARRDWHRALTAVEIVFGSELHGAGHDFALVTGYDDREAIVLLREIQFRLVAVCPGAVG